VECDGTKDTADSPTRRNGEEGEGQISNSKLETLNPISQILIKFLNYVII
jgi:hypothetical protein